MSAIWIVVVVQAVLLVLFGFVLSNVVGRLLQLERAASDRSRQAWAEVLGRRLPPEAAARMGTRDAVVLFVSDTCGTCRALLDSLERARVPDALPVAVFVATDRAVHPVGSSLVLLDDGEDLFAALDISVTPFVVAVHDDAVVYASTATTTADIVAASEVLVSEHSDWGKV